MKTKAIARNSQKKGTVLFCVCSWLIFVLTLTLSQAAIWTSQTFNVSLSGILFTIQTPLAGANSSFVDSALKACLPPVAFGTFCFTFLLLFFTHWKKFSFLFQLKLGTHSISISDNLFFKSLVVSINALLLCMTCYFIERTYDVTGFLKTSLPYTDIYDNYYVMPSSVGIQPPEKKKNLLCIYVESMETTMADNAHGGKQGDINYIPNLTALALNNTSFGSSSTVLGGALSMPNTGWTSAALIATTAGIPFSYPISDNDLQQYGSFAEKLQNLGTILDANGYTQEFLCGSDGTFGGRSQYFSQHGNYRIFDYYYAIRNGFYPEDYYVWWGLEDQKLYEIAKTELTHLSQESAPFNLTMLTVDTHSEHGFVCDICDTEKYSGETLPTVLDCTDRQIKAFLEWCSQQPFYANTTIVILGDHPRMDTDLVEGISTEDRKVYNCFLNAAKAPSISTEGRIFTQLDMFPTILSAMGFEIDGNRLGLGTDLFSETPTLSEELGFDYLSSQLQMQSKFYKENFY